MSKKIRIGRNTTQFLNQAWIRNGDGYVTGEALILAILLHTHSTGRNSDDMRVVQALMNDVNLDDKD